MDLPCAGDGPRHILAAVDPFSKFAAFLPLTNKSARAVVEGMQGIIATFGVPLSLRFDNGAEFAGDFAAWLASLAIAANPGSTYHSNTQGQVERYHRTLATLLRRTLHGMDLRAWPHFLPQLQLTINSTYHRAIGCTPF